MEPLTQIWIVDEVGRPVRHISKDQPFSVVVRTGAPESGEPDDILVARLGVGDQSQTLYVPLVGSSEGTLHYRLEGLRLDDDTAFLDFADLDFSVADGMAINIGLYGPHDGQVQEFDGFAYEVAASREFAIALTHLHAVFDEWNVARAAARRNGGPTDRSDRLEAYATGYLKQLSLGFQAIGQLMESDRWDRRGAARAIAKWLVINTPTDPIAALEEADEPHIGFMWSESRFQSTLWQQVDFYEDDVSDLVDHVWAVATIGCYRGFVAYSGADTHWAVMTNVYAKYEAYQAGEITWFDATGTDEMGQAKTLTDTAIDMAVDKVIDKGIELGLRHLEGGPDLEFKASNNTPRARDNPHGEVEPQVPPVPGRIVDPGTHGIRDDVLVKFQQFAAKHGLVLAMRGANEASTVWQGLGLSGKDTRIKTKTVSPVDPLIGGPSASGVPNGPDSPEGLVGFFDPRLATRPDGIPDADWDLVTNGGRRPALMTDDVEWTAYKNRWAQDARAAIGNHWGDEFGPDLVEVVAKRFTQRRVEYEDNLASIQKLRDQGLVDVRDGLLIDTGLYQGNGMPMTGDLDLFEIVDLNGVPVPTPIYKAAIEELGLDPDMYIRHGAHDRWRQDAPFLPGSKEEGIFLGIKAGHTTDPLLLIGGFGDRLLRTTYVQRAGNDFELISTRDGAVLWSGGVIMRPSPLESNLRLTELDLLRWTRASSLATRLPLPLVVSRQQADSVPPGSGDGETDWDSKWEDMSSRLDDYYERLEDSEGSEPEYEGPADLFEPDTETGGGGDAPDPSPDRRSFPVAKLSATFGAIGIAGLLAFLVSDCDGGTDSTAAPALAQVADEVAGPIEAVEEPVPAEEADALASAGDTDEVLELGPGLESVRDFAAGNLASDLGYAVDGFDFHLDTGPNRIYSIDGTAVPDQPGPPGTDIEATAGGGFFARGSRVRLRYDFSSHPCGLDDGVKVITCAIAPGPVGEGEELVVVVELDAAPEPGATYTYGLALDDDGDSADNYQFVAPFDWDYFRNTEFWYRLRIDADGSRRMWAEEAHPGSIVPRHSSALVMQHGRFLVWVIPRREVPGPLPAYRATAFAQDTDPTELPLPETSAGDVSGGDPTSTLTPIDVASPTPVAVEGIVDTGAADPIPRFDPGPDPDQTMWDAMVEEFGTRASAALDGGSVDELTSLLHPVLTSSPESLNRCRELIAQSIALAREYRVTGPAVVVRDGLFVGAQVPVEYVYPGGAVASSDLLVWTGDGRLAWIFDCG